MLQQNGQKVYRALKNGTAVLAMLALTACSSVPQSETPAEKMMAQVQRDQVAPGGNQQAPEIPNEVSQALLSGSMRNTAEIDEPDRFDISVNNLPAKTFFLSLVADSGVNVVAHPEVAGNISLELKDVSVREVLEVTRDVYGYQYKYSNGIYTIYPRKIRTEIFSINYIDIERIGSTDTSILIGAITSETQNNSGGAGNSGSNQSRNQNKETETSGSRVKTVNKTNFWKLLQKTLTAIVGGGDDGRMVVVNPQAGLVVVKAMPAELLAVKNFLDKSELSVHRQVILETKILEVKLSEGYEAGINWSEIQGQLQYSNNVTEFEAPVDILSATNAGEEIFASIIKVTNIQRLLSLLETQGNVQVLSSPRVSTVNNQKAVIRVGSDEFFVTGISSQQTSTASSTTSTPNIELTSFFSGISLDVTPQIAENGDVILHVHPIVSEVVDQTKEFTVGNEEFSLPMALRDIRESDSVVRAQSGQVVVLGGLMQEILSDSLGKNPILGDIPGVNALFRRKSKLAQKTELVILMRPIVVENDTWNNEIDGSYSRIKTIADEYRER